MSVKELKLVGPNYDLYVEIKNLEEMIVTLDYKEIVLDRNQSHLLMLYLQEHLKCR